MVALDLDSVYKNSLVSLVRELKKMKKDENLEASELPDLISKMVVSLRDKKEFKPEDFLGVFESTRLLLESKDISKSEFARELKEAFSKYGRIMAKGDALEKLALGCWIQYGGMPLGKGLDNVVNYARSMAKLLCEAREKNRKRVVQLTREYYRDLLRSPRPAPEIPRGFSGADLARMLHPAFEKAIEADKETLSKAMKDAFPVLKSYVKGLISKDYLRQEIPKYLNGYKDLVEGDFKRFLNWIVALNRIASGKQTSYSKVTSTSPGKKIEEMKKSSYAILIKTYNRHLRNSVAHTSYDVRLEQPSRLPFLDFYLGEIEFRDLKWKTRMTFTEFMQLFSEMSALLELSLVLGDPEDRKLEEKLSRHRDPGWWERIESKRGLMSRDRISSTNQEVVQ